jgi:hypothetical protein
MKAKVSKENESETENRERHGGNNSEKASCHNGEALAVAWRS